MKRIKSNKESFSKLNPEKALEDENEYKKLQKMAQSIQDELEAYKKKKDKEIMKKYYREF